MSAAAQLEFRTRLRAALALPSVDERLAKLSALASDDLSYLETIQVGKALSGIKAADVEAYAPVRLAVLSSSTIDHLLPAIRVAGLRRKLFVDTYRGQFAQYRQALMGADSALSAFAPSVLLLSLTARDVLGDVPITASKAVADAAVTRAVGDLRELWRAGRERFRATVVQQSLLDVAPPLFGSSERLVPGAPGRLIARVNDELAGAAAEDGVLLLDVARASAADGLAAWFDERHWLQAKIEIAPEAARRYAELLSRLLGAHLGRSRKCLVLDLDNTLWSGVVGDDGIDGIVLGEGSALGEAHLALQKYAKQLKERGVILAVCSKNEWSIVEQAFDNHPEMHLRRDDIAAFAVNWQDKAQNLKQLASQLNIGLDSLVFVDDNPAERARVRESLPMVAVPELPVDPALYVRAIASGGYFEATVLTDEDRSRAAQYAANTQRDALRDAAASVDDFLRGLQMSVDHGTITPVDFSRATQLINKTNQFNTTTRRITGEELAEWATSPNGMALQFRLIDRYGDNGLVSVMLFRADPSNDAAFELANWVMSCRVFGRQLEHEALNIAVETARERGVRTFHAGYVPTEKNKVIANLFADLGFRPLGGEGGSGRWALDLDAYKPHATYIARRRDGRG